VVHEGQQISHHLQGMQPEAGHVRRATADDLLDQLAIVFAVIDTLEIGTHQPLGGQAMAAGATMAGEFAGR
jgi:hypothetical protein